MSEDQNAKAAGREYAFSRMPSYRPDGELVEWSNEGLIKRELFAAMAMQGAMSADAPFSNFSELASLSVEAADALLKELST